MILRDGVVPPALVLGNADFRPAMRGLGLPTTARARDSYYVADLAVTAIGLPTSAFSCPRRA